MMARMDEKQLHHEIWPEIRANIREVNQEAYILGEHWTDDREFLQGDEWDAAMNYFGFGWPVRQFVGELDHMLDTPQGDYEFNTQPKTAVELAAMFKQKLTRLPHQLAYVQFNLFDSHDISRLHNNPDVSWANYRGVVSTYLKEGVSYRTNLFIGAEVDVPVVDAVGTGVDFTYSEHELSDGRTGHFRRYLWDIFFLPVNLGVVQIQPGLAWNVTDVEIPDLDLDEVSIRPAGVISAEIGIPINQQVRLTAIGRYTKIVSDLEETTEGEINISGETVSVLSGVQVRF